MSNEPTISDYKELSSITNNLHYWQQVRKDDLEARDKAAQSLNHADERIATYTEKLQDLLSHLGITTEGTTK